MAIRKNHSLLSLLALAAIGLMTAWAPPAQAQSVGPPCVISPVYMGVTLTYFSGPTSPAPIGLCASEATLAGINDYLQTGMAQGIAGRAAQSAGLSMGVVDQLAIANVQETSFRKQGQQNLANEDVRNRALAVEEAITSAIYKGTTPISTRACHSVASTSSSGIAAGGGGSAGRYKTIKKDQEDAVLEPGTENDYVADIVTMPGAAESCTAADVANRIPGCTAVGSTPGVNLSPFILVRAYTGQPGHRSSYTIKFDESDKLYQAQQGYITYSRPRAGPSINEGSKSEPIARAYLVLQRRYNSRALVVVNTLSHVASKTLSIDPKSPFIANVWNQANVRGGKSLREEFSEIYAGTPIPEIPSEREIMNLLVLRQFTAEQSASDMAMDPVEIERRRLDVKKVNALLLLKMNENAEWNNIMYAHILSSRIDPVTRSQLLSQAAAAN